MKFASFFLSAVFLTCSGVASQAFASDAPAELVKDRARIAQALKEKNPQRAAKLIEPWIKKRPHDVELANDYALALAQMGKLDQAREVLEEALKKNPETGVAFQNLREILSQQAAISYAKAMGKRPPTSQVALKSSAPVPDAPTVVAQVDPRPGASTEPPPAKTPPQPSHQAWSRHHQPGQPQGRRRPRPRGPRRPHRPLRPPRQRHRLRSQPRQRPRPRRPRVPEQVQHHPPSLKRPL